MAAQTLVSAEEYLATDYEHEPDWVDGEVLERPMPSGTHAWTQVALGRRTPVRHGDREVFGLSELRVKIGDRFRVIDYCVYAGPWPGDRPATPPVVAVEILSEGESMSQLLDKMEEYTSWGVRHAWVVDPGHRQLYRYERGLHVSESLSAPEVGLEIRPEQIFRSGGVA